MFVADGSSYCTCRKVIMLVEMFLSACSHLVVSAALKYKLARPTPGSTSSALGSTFEPAKNRLSLRCSSGNEENCFNEHESSRVHARRRCYRSIHGTIIMIGVIFICLVSPISPIAPSPASVTPSKHRPLLALNITRTTHRAVGSTLL